MRAAGQGRGIGFPWETEDGAGWKQARAAKRRIRSHNAENNAGVRRIEVPGAESSGEL